LHIFERCFSCGPLVKESRKTNLYCFSYTIKNLDLMKLTIYFIDCCFKFYFTVRFNVFQEILRLDNFVYATVISIIEKLSNLH